MKTAKVTYSNGQVITTSINGTNAEIEAYFHIGRKFDIGGLGENDNIQAITRLEIKEGEKSCA